MASFKIEFTRSATKDLRAIDRTWVPRILKAIEALEETPRPVGCRKLAGSEFTYRIRIGDYRVIYEVLDATLVIDVIKIRHRREVYR